MDIESAKKFLEKCDQDTKEKYAVLGVLFAHRIVSRILEVMRGQSDGKISC